MELGLAPTAARAQALILAGQVLCDDAPVHKAGDRLPLSGVVRLRGAAAHGYVSRGGLKLAAGLDAFGVSPAGRVCADLGAYEEFLRSKLTQLEGVGSIESSFSLAQVKYSRVLPV